MTASRCFAGVLFFAACVVQAQPVPSLSGRVMDRADVLDASTEDALSDLLAEHEAQTSNQIVVLTVASLGGYSVEEYAEQIFNEWGLGEADRDNGVLVLIARDDREMRIEVGYGLEDPLTDARAGRIIRTSFLPSFRNGDYDAGTLAGVDAILGVIGGTYEPPDDGGGGGDEEMPLFVRLIFSVSHVLLPMLFASMTLFQTGCARYFIVLFFLAFISVGGAVVVPLPYGLLIGPVFLLLYIATDIYMSRSPKWKAIREKVQARTKKGKKTEVSVGGFTFNVGGSSGGSGGFSSGSSGGFSGGGGSSGGGGASGSW